MKLNGAQILVECLKEQGVDTIFGYPGAATINILDELYKHRKDITHVLTAHEQGATHAAEGYAKSSNKVGVCMATSGPGSTNLVTGIADALLDSVPLVAITGNVPLSKIGNDSFQEVDSTGITIPITKYSYMVKDVNKLADIIREAFYIAKEGRPGPVHIDIPKNITTEMAEYEYKAPREIKRVPSNVPAKVIEMIKAAKRPLIFAGGGIRIAEADAELKAFAEKIDAPVSASMMGIGTIPVDHPLYLGFVGMHGSMASNLSFNETDLLICVGTRFSDRVMGNEKYFAQNAKIIQFDVDPAEINKNVQVDEYVIGDAKLALEALTNSLDQMTHPSWIKEVSDIKDKYAFNYNEEELNVPLIIKRISERLEAKDYISTDVGQHQMWTCQHYPFQHSNRLVTSGGLGTMGFGLGAAFGVGYLNRDCKSILITGDGSFRMNFNEIITCVEHKIPVKIFIMNNKTLGMVRQWQNLFYDQRYEATPLADKIDYVMFAKSLGAEGYRANTPEELSNIMDEVFSNDLVCVVDCKVQTDRKVFPMVPPGKAIHEAINE